MTYRDSLNLEVFMLTVELLRSRINPNFVKGFIGELVDFEPRQCLLILGPGRAGKDTLAEFFVREYGYVYNGSSSVILCQKIYPENPEEMYERRHEFKQELFDFGEAIRAVDARYIPYLTLRNNGNLLVGLRSLSDIRSIEPKVKCIIWVNSDVPTDSTMSYTLLDVLTPRPDTLIVNNIQNQTWGLSYLFEQSRSLAAYLLE